MDVMETYLNDRISRDKDLEKIRDEEAAKREVLKMLISLRINEGLTQKKLAVKMKTSQSFIARIEGGKGNPTFKFLVKLEKVFNKNLIIHYA